MKIAKCDVCYAPYQTEANGRFFEDCLRVCDECSPKLINLNEAEVYKILRIKREQRDSDKND